MKRHPMLRIALLATAVAVAALSCSFDYQLDFEITGVILGLDSVQVGYSLYNAGMRAIDDASITIRVEINAGEASLEMSTPGVDLDIGGTDSDTLIFPFSGYTVSTATAKVISAAWNEHDSWE